MAADLCWPSMLSTPSTRTVSKWLGDSHGVACTMFLGMLHLQSGHAAPAVSSSRRSCAMRTVVNPIWV
jgi:hypothetical protein